MRKRLAHAIRKGVMAYQEYSSPVEKVQAEQLEEDRTIITPTGPIGAIKGEWEVRHPDGNVEKLSQEDFEERYQGGSSDTSEKETGEDTGVTESARESVGDPDNAPAQTSEKGDSVKHATSEDTGKTDEKDRDEPPL